MTVAGVRWFIGVFVGCLGAGLAVYWPALRGGFIWDDVGIYIVNNPLLPRSDGLYRFWFTTDPMDYYPLAYSAWWVGVHLFQWGLNPLYYHLTNVVVHALAAAFLAWTLRGLRVPAAALVGLLFALHPMNVESVAWISQLKTCLAGMLAFAAAGCFVRGWRMAALVCFALSLSSKPIAVAFPVAILVYGWWRDGAIKRSVVLQSLPFFFASVLFGAIGVYFQQANAIGPTVVRTGSTFDRLLASSWAVWFYAWKGLFPVHLMFVYPRWDVQAAGPLAFLPGVLLLGLAVLLWIKRNDWGRTPLAAFAVYLLMVLPSSGLVDVYYWRYSYVGDHYVYQALPLVVASAVVSVWMLLRRWQAPPPVSRLAALAALGFFAGQSLLLSKDYKSEVALWEATIRRNPDAWLAHTNLSLKLWEAGDWNAMERHVETAYRLRPDLDESHNNRGLVFTHQGKHEEAARCFRKATELGPFRAVMWMNLGAGLFRLERDEEATAALKKAVDVAAETQRVGPKNVRPLFEYGSHLARIGRLEEALAAFEEAGSLEANEPLVPVGIGRVRATQQRFAEAAAEFRRALKMAPNFSDAHYELGRMQERLGDSGAALQSYLAGASDKKESLAAAAWMRAASPKKELRDAAWSLQMVDAMPASGVYAGMVFDAHAVALAANGRFADAVQANDRAIAACRSSRVKDAPQVVAAVARLEGRGKQYRNRQAYTGPTSEMTPVLSRELLPTW